MIFVLVQFYAKIFSYFFLSRVDLGVGFIVHRTDHIQKVLQ